MVNGDDAMNRAGVLTYSLAETTRRRTRYYSEALRISVGVRSPDGGQFGTDVGEVQS